MFYQGDAVSEIKKIKATKDGHLDFSTMPDFAVKDKEIVGSEQRDLGAMISMLTVAVQQLTDRIEKLEKNK
jgi:hypothetical protein